jgi:RND superfamily putative drug exporter
MVDEEVENTLREIRERVRLTAEFEADSPRAVVSSAANGSHTPGNECATKTAEITARIDAHLTTTARAWDRLPPLVSKRSGGLARLELWVKRRFKRATRWYSWEQINFNAAVHHALRDVLDALLDLKQQLQQQREEMGATLEARAQQLEARAQQLEARAQQLEARAQQLEARAQQLEQNQIEIKTLRAEIESQRTAMEAYRAKEEEEQQARSLEVNMRLTDLAREVRERDGQILEEQRVSFKQLSLEMSETEVLLDRARRDIDSRLNKLESSKS